MSEPGGAGTRAAPGADRPVPRIIARLDVKNDRVIKGVRLEGLRPVGVPVEMAPGYYREGADEVLFMDAVASLYDRNALFHIIDVACREVFVPVTLGGGIRSVHDVEAALRAGADKVAINTALARRPGLADEVAATYGSQCLVGSIDAKSMDGRWQAFVDNGREPTGRDVLQWAAELEDRGVGELLVTSVDREGTRTGFDLDLYRALADAVTVPVIASGGAGAPADLHELLCAADIQGAAFASALHYRACTIADLKQAVAGAGRPGSARP